MVLQKSQWGKIQKRASVPPPRLRETKKIRSGTSAGSQGVKYISAGAPTGVKKVKDA